MAKFRVLAQWAVTGDYYVEAESREEAITKVRANKQGPLPSATTFVDGTFFVHEDLAERLD